MKFQFLKIKPYLFFTVLFFIPVVIFLFYKTSIHASHVNQSEKVIKPRYAIAVHGGAGNFTSADLGRRNEILIQASMLQIIETGANMLKNGSKAVEVAESVVVMLENDSLFNAGKGAVLNIEGKAELDAAIMDGKTMKAGAVAAVKTIKNPVKAARRIMDSTSYLLLVGDGADLFAKTHNLEIVDNTYFVTKQAKERYQNKMSEIKSNQPKGTVGCVVLDQYGDLASATSTGGLWLKMQGRVGDSPLIGAGTYASNKTCAVSCTGTGEYFIRASAAGLVSSLVQFSGYTISQAVDSTLSLIARLGGHGGMIAVSRNGEITINFNTTAMIRAYTTDRMSPVIELYKIDSQ